MRLGSTALGHLSRLNMIADTAPLVYNSKLTYYSNFYLARSRAMATTGDFNAMWQDAWSLYDNTITVVDHNGTTVVNNGIDITWYVKKNFNDDMPTCLADTIAKAIADIIYYSGGAVAEYVFNAVSDFLSDLFGGSFVCTATFKVLGTKCGNELLTKLKGYRDATMTDRESIFMLKYYEILGPRIVDAINEDEYAEDVYKYLYAEYISWLSKAIDNKDSAYIMHVYFKMIDAMVIRYDIRTGKRYKRWLQNLT